jgi:BlaI family penicillinase repressor
MKRAIASVEIAPGGFMSDDVSPSGRELDVLRVLWQTGDSSVRDVYNQLYPDLGLAFNTVQTVLRNMEKKGLVGHRAEDRTFIYFPRYTREQITSYFLMKVFGGAWDQCILSILKVANATLEDLHELRPMTGVHGAKKSKLAGEQKMT